MNAIDTNVLVYSFDTDDPVRQQQALDEFPDAYGKFQAADNGQIELSLPWLESTAHGTFSSSAS